MPGAGGTQRLTRAIGKARAMELILTGRTMSAREAQAAGLVTSVVPAAATVDAALELARPDRGHAAARRPCRQGGHPRRRPSARSARGWRASVTHSSACSTPRTRPRGWPPSPRNARPSGRDADPSEQGGQRWSRTPTAAATSGATMGASSATSRRRPSATARPTTSRRSTSRRRSAATQPAPESTTSPVESPEQDWSIARGLLYPAFRPVGTQGLMLDTIDRESLAAHGTMSHAQPLIDVGPAELPVVYTIDAGRVRHRRQRRPPAVLGRRAARRSRTRRCATWRPGRRPRRGPTRCAASAG